MEKIYTCPMHPEVRRQNPGTCPKCGMNLVLDERTKQGVEQVKNKFN